MKNITLKDFLLLFHNDNFKFTRFNLINTDNNSFPKEFRRKHENPASLFSDLYRKDCTDLLNKNIKYIALLPVDVNLDKDEYEFDFEFNFEYGFMRLFSSEDNFYQAQHIYPVIHIVLEDEEVKNES